MIRIGLALALSAGMAQAETLRVATDIAPVQALVAQVTGEMPALLVPPGADPHHFALAPSDAAALAEADLVIWVGPDLTPWLERPLAALAEGASHVALMDVPGWEALPSRDGHGHMDPHGWLSPAVAAVWTGAIAEALAGADPDRAQAYRDNAARVQADLEALATEVAGTLEGIGPYVVPHDAYRYFEEAFGVPSAGAVTEGDHGAPGPAHLAALRDRITAGEIVCVLAPVGPEPGWLPVLQDGTAVRTGTIDDLGAALPPGPDLYPALIRGIAESLRDCAGT